MRKQKNKQQKKKRKQNLNTKETLVRRNTPLSHETLCERHYIKRHIVYKQCLQSGWNNLEGLIGRRILGMHGNSCEQLINTLEIRQLWPNCPVVGMLQDRAGYKLLRSARALVTTLVTYMGMSYELLDVICKSVQNFHVSQDIRSYCIFYEEKISNFL